MVVDIAGLAARADDGRETLDQLNVRTVARAEAGEGQPAVQVKKNAGKENHTWEETRQGQ